MKTKLFKTFISTLLALIMLMLLIPMSAMAATYDNGGNITSTFFTLQNFNYGKTVISGNAVGETSVVWVNSTKFYESEKETPTSKDDLNETTDNFFQAGKQYYCEIDFSEHIDLGKEHYFDRVLIATLTCNGVSCERIFDLSGNTKVFVYKLPILDAVSMAIPFTKIVEQSGSVAPGNESFELEIKNLYNGSNSPIDNYTIDGLSFTTDGSGTSDKQFTITSNNFEAILQLLNEGILVSEKQSGNAGWQYDDTVWCVRLHHAPVVNALDDETPTMPGYSFDFFKGEMVNDEFIPDSQASTDKMTFTNIYTEDTEAVVTIKIPFVKNVTLGDDIAPTGETFKFEIFDIGNSNIDNYADVTYTAEVTVSGKGEFEGEISITGPESQVEQYICEGFFVREVKGDAANWTYSDAVWYVIPEWNEQQERMFVAYPTTKETSDNGDYYVIAEDPAEKIIFENIYTENKAIEPSSPQTGDNSMMGLWIALLFASGFGVAATIVISKKISVR